MTVLIVEDSEDTLLLLKTVFDQAKAKVLAASTAAEALEILQNSRPNFIVSDIGMPDTDGYELLKESERFPA